MADFWPWFNQLHDSEKIAYWAMLVSIATALVGVIVGFIAAVFGAKYGARAAFNLGRDQQQKDETSKRISALLVAQYALYSQWNVIEGIKRTSLEPRRNHPTRFLQMADIYVPDVAQRVPFSDIAFLVSFADANLLQEIQIAEQCYDTFLRSVKLLRREQKALRNNPNVKRKSDFDFETGTSLIEAAPRDVFMLKAATDNLFDIAEHSQAKLFPMLARIDGFLSKHFPKMGTRLAFTPITPVPAVKEK